MTVMAGPVIYTLNYSRIWNTQSAIEMTKIGQNNTFLNVHACMVINPVNPPNTECLYYYGN